MKLAVKSENPMESVALMAGLVPSGLLEAWIAPVVGRAWIAAVRLGLFEALAEGHTSARAVADRCQTGSNGTKALLDAMAGIGAVERSGGHYSLSGATKKWFVRSSDKSVADFVDFLGVQWDWLNELEQYVRTDRPLDIHRSMSETQWDAYQRGMRAAANFLAPELGKRLPVPAGATQMLDVGGSHGFYSVVLCRRYPDLQATVLDLPEAVAAAAPLLAKEGMGERVKHRSGNALEEDLGSEQYDLILLSDLVHHFDDETNRRLVDKCARALRPGGAFVMKDVIRGEDSAKAKQFPLLGALGVMMISESTMWTVPEMASWISAAGLTHARPIWLRGAPGVALVVGRKPT